jgi:hypothetical protein
MICLEARRSYWLVVVGTKITLWGFWGFVGMGVRDDYSILWHKSDNNSWAKKSITYLGSTWQQWDYLNKRVGVLVGTIMKSTIT